MSTVNMFNVTTQPPRIAAPETISAKAEAVNDLSARLDRLGIDLENRIGSIDSRLTDQAQSAEIVAMRAAFADATAPLVAKLVDLRDELAAQAPHYSPLAVRSRAHFGETTDPLASAALGSFVLARCAAAPSHVLLELARFAASTFDHAACAVIEAEVARRGELGELGAEIVALCNSVPLPSPAAAAAQKLGDAYGVAELARIGVEERIAGASKPTDRLTAAFAAGKLTGKPPLPKAAA